MNSDRKEFDRNTKQILLSLYFVHNKIKTVIFTLWITPKWHFRRGRVLFWKYVKVSCAIPHSKNFPYTHIILLKISFNSCYSYISLVVVKQLTKVLGAYLPVSNLWTNDIGDGTDTDGIKTSKQMDWRLRTTVLQCTVSEK